MTEDAVYFELAACAPGWDRARWDVFRTLSPALQADVLANERAQDWTKPGSSKWTRVLELLAVLATVAVDVTGIAGAIASVSALKAI